MAVFFIFFRVGFSRARALGGFAGVRAAAQRVQRRGGVETAHGVVEAHTGQTHVHFAEIRVFVQHVQHRRTFLFVKKNVFFLTVSFASRVGVVLVAARVEKRRQERRGASVETRTQGQAHHAERELTLSDTRVRSRVRSFSRSGSFWKLLRRSTAALGESSARERAAGARLAGVPPGAGVVREQRRGRRVLRGGAREHRGVTHGRGDQPRYRHVRVVVVRKPFLVVVR